MRRLVLLTSAVLMAGVVVALGIQARDASRALATRALPEGEVRDRDIAFYEERVQRDPSGSMNMAQLAALYLQRSRESGNRRDLERAEASAQRSLAASAGNGKARLVLASTLLAQHRFQEGLLEAVQLVNSNPDVPAYRALLGELQLETGDLEGARATFEGLKQQGGEDLSVAARVARWHEISGRSEEALRILRASLDEAQSRRDLPSEQVAWFYLRIGDLLSRDGRLDNARASYVAGLEVRPNDYRLLASLAKLSFMERRWKEAIDLAEQSAAVDPVPAVVALIADSWEALGDLPRAEAARARVGRDDQTAAAISNRQ